MCVCVVSLDTEDVSVEMTNLELELSSLVDLDLTTARFFASVLYYYCIPFKLCMKWVIISIDIIITKSYYGDIVTNLHCFTV